MAWHLMKDGEPNAAMGAHKEFMLDSDADITNEPDESEFGKISPGSIAYTCEPSGGIALDMLWMKAWDGSWAEM